MICLGQGGLHSPSASSLLMIMVIPQRSAHIWPTTEWGQYMALDINYEHTDFFRTAIRMSKLCLWLSRFPSRTVLIIQLKDAGFGYLSKWCTSCASWISEWKSYMIKRYILESPVVECSRESFIHTEFRIYFYLNLCTELFLKDFTSIMRLFWWLKQNFIKLFCK